MSPSKLCSVDRNLSSCPESAFRGSISNDAKRTSNAKIKVGYNRIPRMSLLTFLKRMCIMFSSIVMLNEESIVLIQKEMGMRIPYRDSNWHRRHWLMETALIPCHRSTAAECFSCGDGFTQDS
ncbi:hypothetical protein TNCT_681931 [Trichonephila clavata]|uniref:Uncharacterized protein n=1 Tax=Trichonephila clavata TaxID=2740835 RepID=A0A8X6L4J6_TRICU|nr:hypothetical protein TNCT_681931 [Trichonephila clavata]